MGKTNVMVKEIYKVVPWNKGNGRTVYGLVDMDELMSAGEYGDLVIVATSEDPETLQARADKLNIRIAKAIDDAEQAPKPNTIELDQDTAYMLAKLTAGIAETVAKDFDNDPRIKMLRHLVKDRPEVAEMLEKAKRETFESENMSKESVLQELIRKSYAEAVSKGVARP